MNPPTTLTNHNPPATIGCGLNPNPIRREESDTPHRDQPNHLRKLAGTTRPAPRTRCGATAPVAAGAQTWVRAAVT